MSDSKRTIIRTLFFKLFQKWEFLATPRSIKTRVQPRDTLTTNKSNYKQHQLQTTPTTNNTQPQTTPTTNNSNHKKLQLQTSPTTNKTNYKLRVQLHEQLVNVRLSPLMSEIIKSLRRDNYPLLADVVALDVICFE